MVAEVLSEPPPRVAMDPGLHLRWLIETHIRLTEAMQPWFVFAYMEAKAFPPSERKIAIDSEALTESMIARALERGVQGWALHFVGRRTYSVAHQAASAGLVRQAREVQEAWNFDRQLYHSGHRFRDRRHRRKGNHAQRFIRRSLKDPFTDLLPQRRSIRPSGLRQTFDATDRFDNAALCRHWPYIGKMRCRHRQARELNHFIVRSMRHAEPRQRGRQSD